MITGVIKDLRWSRFKHLAPSEMYAVVGEHVFPFLRTLGGDADPNRMNFRPTRRDTGHDSQIVARITTLMSRFERPSSDTMQRGAHV